MQATMTPKERWLALLHREKADRLPMDYWGTKEATQKLLRYLGCRTVWQMYKRLHIDRVVSVRPKYVGPRLRSGYDMYGRRFKWIGHSDGAGSYRECVYHPLACYSSVEEVARNYTWPTADWFDYTDIPRQIRSKSHYPIQGGGSEPFLIYKELRGMEQAYIDMVENPELVHYCLDQLFAFCYENTRRVYAAIPGQVNLSYIAEDFGGQTSLLFSPNMIRQYFIPRMKRMIDLAHEHGVFAFFHSDGAIHEIIPDMIAAGIDILNPVQWRCPGMDRAMLKQEFGNQLIFHGGMDNQQTLPFGTVADVRREVIENIEMLGPEGYVLAPCHNIQVVSPPENIVAMYETGFSWALRQA